MKSGQKLLAIKSILPGDNDRSYFPEAALKELADHIKEHGLIQPIMVRQKARDGKFYEIIAGERRFRAVRFLGWTRIPAHIKKASDEQAAALMLAENMSRADLDPIEESEAYDKRMKRFGWTIEQCAKAAGVTQVRVQFRLKLLRLLPQIRDLIRSGNLAIGYGQILSDGELDPGFQMVAFKKFRDNPHPTPPWFRMAVTELHNKQAQGIMFGSPLFTGFGTDIDSQPAMPDMPPEPRRNRAPMIGKTLKDKLHSQISFWEQASEAWRLLGKSFKQQECQAAVSVLRAATG